MGRLIALIKISRPILWLGPILIYTVAFITRGTINTNYLLGLIFVTFPMGILVYGLNDISDMESDRYNQRKGGIEGYLLKSSEVNFLRKSILGTVLAATFIFLLITQIPALFIALSIYVWGYLYSVKPFRFKRIPILDSFSNGLWMLLVFVFGRSLATSTLDLNIPIAIWCLGLGVVALHALTTLMDLDADERVGDLTIGRFLGIRRTIILCLLTFCLIVYLLSPLTPVLLVFLISIILGLLVLMVKPTSSFIHNFNWYILLGFPAVILYLLLFNFSYLQILL